MKALFSIKPEYVNRILSGEKKYEFRRRIFKRQDIDKIVIYSTLPEGAIVAEASIISILQANPDTIWEQTHEYGGISKSDFMHYFEGSTCAYAIKLGMINRFSTPVQLADYSRKINHPPQSFAYID